MGRLQAGCTLLFSCQGNAWPERADTWTGKGQDRAVNTYCYRAHSIAFTPEKVMASCNKQSASLLSWDGAGRRPITCPLGVWLGQASAWPGMGNKKGVH